LVLRQRDHWIKVKPEETHDEVITGYCEGILAAVAQHEREMIGERTKAALQAAKARGVKLGRQGAETLAPKYQQEALQWAAALKPVLREMLASGHSYCAIAAELNDRKVPTPRGGKWHPQMISRTVERLAS
jgi:DNA invertase Pin-like site-specific DNA recombinase